MKHIKHISLILSVGFLLLACSGHNNAAFDRAASLMDSLPDSALTILNAVDTTRLDRDGKARRALLLSEAYYKNFIDVADDSLASVAYGYYVTEGHGSDSDRMLSAFLLALVCDNAGDTFRALDLALEAENFGRSTADNYRLGLILSLQSDLYKYLYNNRQALDKIMEAERYFQLAGKDRHLTFANIDRATLLSNMGKYIKSLNMLDSIQKTSSDTIIMASASFNAINPMIGLNMYSQAKTMINSNLNKKIFSPSAQLYAFLAECYYNEHDIKSGDTVIKFASQLISDNDDHIYINEALRTKFQILGNTDSMSYYKNLNVNLKDSLSSKTFNHIQKLNKSNPQPNNNQSGNTLLLSIIVILSLIIIALLFSFFRKRGFSREYRSPEPESKEVSESREAEKSCPENKNIVINNSFLIKDCEDFIYSCLTKPDRKKLLESRFDRNWFIRLTDFINEAYSDSMTIFDRTFENVDPLERKLFMLSTIGMPNGASAEILDLSKDVLSNRKSRLRQKISKKFNMPKYRFGTPLPDSVIQ